MTRFHASRHSLLSLLLALGLVPVGCSATAHPTPIGSHSGIVSPTTESQPSAAVAASSPPPVDAVALEPVVTQPEPLAWKAPPSLGMSPEGNQLPNLPRFFTLLLQLERGQRNQPVRIAWLGDSHTQPDIWTDAVRRPLQQRAGVGGPGFIHVGWNKWGYGNAGAALEVHGRWSIQPPGLLSTNTYDDGVLGLGGVRLVPQMGTRARIKVSASALPGPARWELAFRTKKPDALLKVRPVGGVEMDVRFDPQDTGVRYLEWTSNGPGGGFEVEAARAGVELFGVVVEATEKPGVLVDVLGLNGARIVHALAWDEAAWTAALGRRQPNLVVLAYGSNEAGIPNLDMEQHRASMVALLDRARKAAPDVDCLVIGAMDRAGPEISERVERINEAQGAAANDRGCAFWSAQKAMGGRNSMQAWALKSPPWAAPDHVHLEARGYNALGALLARDLLLAYDAGIESKR